ncbi:MAG: 5-formyltetrahydrofolate cyclo-ligase [Lachnospiraceae bacterium]|nr:5-formyltetrahydrofolate cyclo-ligase [Lachnospiraceae bacterium]
MDINKGTESEKNLIRKQALKNREELDGIKRREADINIADKLLMNPLYSESHNILIYVSCNNEVDTLDIMEESFKKRKKVFVPKGEGKGIMNFYKITALDQLSDGKFGIPEPVFLADKFERTRFNPSDSLLVMPGVAFGKDNSRIGYGGGFYDRFLLNYPELKSRSIALCYDCQIFDKVPQVVYDIKPYKVIHF